MSKKMTIAYFKEAIKQDGNVHYGINALLYVLRQIEYAHTNVHYGVSALLYVLRQIEYAHADGALTDKQKDKLWHWAYDKYAE
jgi:hypothetical protein